MKYRAGSPEGQHFAQDMTYAFRTGLPFLRKWGFVPNDDHYQTLYQQMLQELQQPDFEAIWTYITCWGTNPPKNEEAFSITD